MQKPTLAVVMFISALLAFAIIPTVYAIIVVSKAAADVNTVAISPITKVAFKDHYRIPGSLKSKNVLQIIK